MLSSYVYSELSMSVKYEYVPNTVMFNFFYVFFKPHSYYLIIHCWFSLFHILGSIYVIDAYREGNSVVFDI